MALVLLAAATSLLAPARPAHASPVGECQVVATSQVEVTECLRIALAAADQVMSAALDRLLRRADELDQVTGRPTARPAVEAAQVEWQAFREANCAVPAALAGGASGSGQFELGCFITMARARAADLDALAAGLY